MKDYYRLSSTKKREIAQNLIDILEKDIRPSKETVIFISKWITSDRSKKFKAYYDVWEIVLKNFYPKTRPVLIRSIPRKSKAKYIGSFTDSVISAERFGMYKGYWIICDTKCSLSTDQSKDAPGNYTNTFYPLNEVLRKAKEKGGWGFANSFLERYEEEGEYIMKINFSVMQLLKYIG
ncbi:hypothetical protein CMU30_06890 [Elizabethkingia anophelis]|nr:hypothetical protein [Elizabethkingia anophelis]MDV3684140.1 hypothetical protein [Elizabethkingia anophelis]MDV3700968.1 hypothetical protein [Elizabethkingia anophelis]MDV3763124.1 hypothetical protein [Elizabethkingia anophelis]MDV3801266.1 hypothetical protein [Elizabethkingia anophelis]